MIKKWKFDKKVKRHEMKAIVRKRAERQRDVPSKQSAFRVRGQPVNSDKVDRFQKANPADQGSDIEMLDRKLSSPFASVRWLLLTGCEGTPSEISCWTPLTGSRSLDARSSVVSALPDISVGQEASSSPFFTQRSLNPDPFSAQRSSRVSQSSSAFMNQFINWDPSSSFRSSQLHRKSKAANSFSLFLSLPTFSNGPSAETIARAKNIIRRSPTPSRHHSPRSPSSSGSLSSDSKSPSPYQFGWWPAYGNRSARLSFPKPHPDPRFILQSLMSMHEHTEYQLSIVMSKLDAQLGFDGGSLVNDCDFCRALTILAYLGIYSHYEQRHSYKSSLSHTLDYKIWISEIMKSVLLSLEAGNSNYFDPPFGLAQVCVAIGFRDKIRIIL